MEYQYTCPSCSTILYQPFDGCPACGFTTDHLVHPISPEAKKKMLDHTQLLVRDTVELGGRPAFNASFDYYGHANLDELVRYTVTFGHRTEVSSGPGRQPCSVIAAYIPEVIGSGISRYSEDYMPCSGVCIISPTSAKWGHPFPMLDQFVDSKMGSESSVCFRCGSTTPVAHPVCINCYGELGNDWKSCLTLDFSETT